MSYYSKGSYLIVGFNKTGSYKEWRQHKGTGITIIRNIIARKDKDKNGFDLTGLRRWTWIRIKGKANELKAFISAYRSYKNRNNPNSV